MDESRKAQLLLERSLQDRQQQLQHKTQEWQGKEQELFTKVTTHAIVVLHVTTRVVSAALACATWHHTHLLKHVHIPGNTL
jgi:hypothetical protein